MPPLNWSNPITLESKSYICGYCGNPLASEKGWGASIVGSGSAVQRAFVYICHHCSKPSFIDENNNCTPGSLFGNTVQNISEESVDQIYDEARKCTSIGAYTAAVLCCRKLLMHIAVSKGAKAGLNFIDYVQFLADNHFVPPDAKEWVDQIRKKGNEANHDISIMNKENAEELISFSEMLLKILFEFPARIKKDDKP